MKHAYVGLVFLICTYALYLMSSHVHAMFLYDLSSSATIPPLWRHIAAYVLGGP
ncbi:MAG: hypothetical protein OWR52_05965 [Acidibacillus sp.]|nr:hypothetical protein [Acidibacillus sp.]